MAASSELTFWCGSYTGDNGDGRGIYALGVGGGSEPALTVIGVAAETDSPSFLAAHPRHPLVYAAGEFVETVQAFRRDGDTLTPVGEAWHAGYAVCHVAADPHAKFIVASCYGDGQVVHFSLDDDGAIVARQSAQAASDPYADHYDEPRPSRAHMSRVLPDGRVLSTDLGHDLVRVWRAEPEGLMLDHEVVLPEGSGPRHLTVHPEGYVYVVSELSSEVFVLAPSENGTYSVVYSAPAVHAAKGDNSADADGGSGGDSGGDSDGEIVAGCEITLSADARFVHTTTRGPNVITTHAVRDGGARLESIADTPCGGNWPRHHIEIGDALFVANQRSSDVTSFSLDTVTGIPTLVATTPVGTPTCLLPVH